MKEIMKRIGKPDTRTMLAVIATMGALSYIGILMVHPVPKENVPLLNTLLPMVVSSILGLCFGYYFGSAKKEEPKKTTDASTN